MIYDLFYIDKNTNSNEIHLYVNIENNTFVPFSEGPYKDCLIQLMWHTKEETINNKYPIEDLSSIESYGYNYTILQSSEKKIIFTMNKIPDRKILVKLHNNTAKSYIVINNNTTIELINIFFDINSPVENITFTNFFGFTKIINHILVKGKDVNTGKIESEKIIP